MNMQQLKAANPIERVADATAPYCVPEPITRCFVLSTTTIILRSASMWADSIFKCHACGAGGDGRVGDGAGALLLCRGGETPGWGIAVAKRSRQPVTYRSVQSKLCLSRPRKRLRKRPRNRCLPGNRGWRRMSVFILPGPHVLRAIQELSATLARLRCGAGNGVCTR